MTGKHVNLSAFPYALKCCHIAICAADGSSAQFGPRPRHMEQRQQTLQDTLNLQSDAPKMLIIASLLNLSDFNKFKIKKDNCCSV